MAIRESLGKGFSLAFSSWSVLFVFFVYSAAVNLINVRLTEQSAGAAPGFTKAFILPIVISVLIALIGIFFQAGLTGYMTKKIKEGTAKLDVFIRTGVRYYLPLVVIGLVVLLILAVVFAAIFFINRLLSANLGVVSGVLMGIIGLVGVYFFMTLLFAPYAVVVDDEKPLAAIRKSMGLVQKNIIAVFVIGVVLLLSGFGAGILMGIILGLVGVVVPSIAGAQLPVVLLSSLVNALIGLFMTGAYTNLYLRVKHSSELGAR